MAAPQVRISSTAGIGANTGVKFLVLGQPGSGKTRLCATMPNPIILSAEAGLLSLRKANLPYIEIKNVQDFNNAWLWVAGSAEARKFASICIDSLSEIAENELAYAKRQTKDGRKAYGDTQEQVEIIMRNFRNLQGPHIYFSAKMEMDKDGAGNPFPKVMMPGNKLAQNVPFIFDEVFHLVRSRTPEGQAYSSLRTAPMNEWDCVKDRSGNLDAWEGPAPGSDLPSLGQIIQKIVS